MNDTNKERAAFEAWYASQPDAPNEPERSYELDEAGMNDLTKYCIWEGWQARAAKAPAAEPVATVYTMEALVPGGSVKHHVQLLKPLPAGTPLYTAPPAPTEQWRDIDGTAPRDGTELLLWREDCGQFIGSYTSADALHLPQHEIDELDEETLFAKDWFTQLPNPWRLDGSEAPTKWRHLPEDPAPPQGAAKGDGNG